jgi:acyl-ACP thioesterase
VPSKAELVPLPDRGRRFTSTRRVRLGDATAKGRLRLDALVRYLQDVSSDDTDDAQLPDAGAWVVRKTVLRVERPAAYGEQLELTTFCSGTGSRWAERRTSITGDRGGHIEAASTWVFVDLETGRPRRLPDAFDDLYGEACGGRQVKARLVHPEPPADAVARSWPLRATDFDVLGHVNNAAYWEPVEDVVAGRGLFAGPVVAELEHRTAVEPGAAVEVVVEDGDPVRIWWRADGVVAASALVGQG